MPVASAVAQQEISQQQSLTLMRNMMRLYLSNVCHGRGLFPESGRRPPLKRESQTRTRQKCSSKV